MSSTTSNTLELVIWPTFEKTVCGRLEE